MNDYLSEMLYALTSAYSRKDYDNCQQGLPMETNIGKLFSIFAWGLNFVEEELETIRLWINIDNALGSTLDRYGANYGVRRVSSDEDFYRLAIKTKIMSQLSGGDINTVLQTVSSLLGVEPSYIQLEEIYPAKIKVYVDQELISPERLKLVDGINSSIKRILAAGIGAQLYLCEHNNPRCDVIPLRTGILCHTHTTGEVIE